MQHASIRWLARLATPGLLMMALVSTGTRAADGPPSTGLGQAWPSATDVSASPRWHVYVFQRDGIRYIQINDLGGTVRAAFATSGGAFLVLPVGVDATRLATPQQPQPAPASTTGDVVYQDAAVKVLVAPQADGTVQVRAASGDCKDPIECSARIN
ncbi:hypothetical protein ACXU4B_04395 [Dyella soli]|uniref:Uncharacterized protein n=1 Tax=Dyella soli TaxID=522319 RepID=A0A4R0YTW0_9GAMM|nr:hypothetical protein [Dyella soli]TCI10258.1 hypothetical protein EZM97_15270 [Dyella soli]